MLQRALCIFGNVYGLTLLNALIYIPGMFFLSRRLGLHIQKVSIFHWKLYEFQWKGVIFSIGCVPLGVSVNHEEGELASTNDCQVISLHLFGVASLLLILTAYYWRGGSLEPVISGFRQFYDGTFEPFQKGSVLIGQYFEAAKSSVTLDSLGLLSTKLLPIYLLGSSIGVANRVVANLSTVSKGESVATGLAFLVLFAYAIWALATAKFILHG